MSTCIDTLEDVMDMIVGWYPIRNINFEPVVHFDFKK